MTERIKRLTEKTIKGEMFNEVVTVEYDRTDHFLSPVKMSAKRVCEYIAAQDLIINEDTALTGLLHFDGSVEGDIFGRSGHRNFQILLKDFYNKPVNNLLTFEWQHSVGDFEKIIKRGISGILADIEDSRRAHSSDPRATEFLETQRDICRAIIKRAEKGSLKADELAEKTESAEAKSRLIRLSEGLRRVPENPAGSFYEAVLCLNFCWSFIPDSIGLIDRYLYPYYKKDIETGRLTENEAKEYLQELYLTLQARTWTGSDRFYRGGESHFCIGGYTAEGEDGFNELSRLIVDSLMELPTWIPQISLRYTAKTPREIFRYLMDCERKDPNKRIAFVNDDPRIKGLMSTGIPYEEAVSYTMMGCNELALPGGMVFGFDPMNIVRSVEKTFFGREEDIISASDFEAFYEVYEQELFKDLNEAEGISKGMQDVRNRDTNLVSNIFLEGPIKNAKSCTSGGLDRYIAVGLLIGITTVIDSLTAVKQFVFDEKRVTMKTLTEALHKNWEGYEALRETIRSECKYFGNNAEISSEMARRFLASISKWNTGDNYLGKKWLFGNLVGYNEHHKFFGDNLNATPDGRGKGDMITFGIGQSEGRDREGLTALLSSIATCDPECMLTGPSVTNVLLQENLITDDESFEKTVDLFRTYFALGGTHFQLTYVSKEDLLDARIHPEKHKSLRVRVSGFSDYFNYLNDGLQQEIINRTVVK